MSDIRTALIRYEDLNGRFVTTLDSLVEFVKTDSLYRAAADSIFGSGFVADSVIVSPRSGKRFVLTINDTSRVKTYMLQDPDSEDHIGSLEPDVTKLNAASWE